MAVVWPSKNNFANGDVLTAANMNNIADTLNVFNPTSATNGQVWVANGSGSGAYASVAGGLNLVTPSSVTATSGTITINTNGSVSMTNVTTAFSINGVFTSTYRNYLILWDFVPSGSAAVEMRLRASGTDSTASYNVQRFDANGTTVSGSRSAGAVSAAVFSGSSSTLPFGCAIWMFGPQLNRRTAWRIVNASSYGATTPGIQEYSNNHDVAAQYDGFSMIFTPQTITGEMAVYGLRN